MVKIIENGEELKLSKRAGTIITLEELVEKVGVDAARYSLTRYPTDTPLTLDVDLLKKRTNENPVFYVQYAHARISALLRNAKEIGMKVEIADFKQELLDSEVNNIKNTLVSLDKDFNALFSTWVTAIIRFVVCDFEI